jgi:hypothetical protein
MAMTFENAPTKSIDVNGTSFVYREFGGKVGVPVVLLHHLRGCLKSPANAKFTDVVRASCQLSGS